MPDIADQLKERTKKFGLRVIRVVQSLGTDSVSRTIGNQLVCCGTSVGANYRAACRARSVAEFRSKLGIVEEETDESIYWMEILIEAGLVPEQRLNDLMNEANEIVSIVVKSIITSRNNN